MGDDAALLSRHRLRSTIHNCRRCPLHNQCRKPVPFSGPSPNNIAVIGEAPGNVEDARNQPFVGPAGQLARDWLSTAGLDPYSVAWLNVVCCNPHGTPLPTNVEACSVNLERQLSFIDPTYILVLGSVALSALYHPGSKITQLAGLWFQPPRFPGRFFLATYHPAGILRGGRANEAKAINDITYFALMAHEEMTPTPNTFCPICNDFTTRVIDGITFCHRHGPKSRLRVEEPTLWQ